MASLYDLTGDGPSDLIDRTLLQSLNQLRVKELQRILQSLSMPKTGPKPELVRRLTEMGTSTILLRHAGGKNRVENVIKHAHRQLAAERGQTWEESRPSVYTLDVGGVLGTGRGEKRRHSLSNHDEEAARAVAQKATPADPGVWARVLACDPFWAAAECPKLASTPGVVMPPTRLTRQSGGSVLQCLQRPFILSREQYDLLKKDAQKPPLKREYQLQLACTMVDDEVLHRIHWPFVASVRVNQAPLPVMYRQPGSAMGKAGRDPPVEIPLALLSTGRNSLFISCTDRRSFAVVIRIGKRRSVDQVKGLVPAPAGFPAARAFVEKALGGGANDDDDDMIVDTNAILSLRCPISGQVCGTPARTKKCTSLAVFDLDTYIKLNEGVRKWTCPHCGAEGRPGDIVVDGFLTRVLGVLRARSKDGVSTDVSRVEVEPSGRWRLVAGDDGGPPASSTAGEPWVETEAMSGVVLGLGGSVLHVPPELQESKGGKGRGGDGTGATTSSPTKAEARDGEVAASQGVTTLESDGEETDEEEEMRRAVLEARRGQPPPPAPEDDVIVIDDSDSDEVQEAPALFAVGNDLASMTEAAAVLSQTLTMEREEKEREERERAAAADAAAEASAAAMVAVEAAAGAIAASFRAARDNQRLNSPSAYSALASAYYDQRSSLSAADAARSRLSSGEASSTPAPPAGGEARVSTAAAMAVPSPLDIARGAGAPPPASGNRPTLKFVMRRPGANAEAGTGTAVPVPPPRDPNGASADMERWFNS